MIIPPKIGGHITKRIADTGLKGHVKSALIAVVTSNAPNDPEPQHAPTLNHAITVMQEQFRVKLQSLDGTRQWQYFRINNLFDLTDEGILSQSEVLREMEIAYNFLHEQPAELIQDLGFEKELDAFNPRQLKRTLADLKNKVRKKMQENKRAVYAVLKPIERHIRTLKLFYDNAGTNPKVYILPVDSNHFIGSPDPSHFWIFKSGSTESFIPG